MGRAVISLRPTGKAGGKQGGGRGWFWRRGWQQGGRAAVASEVEVVVLSELACWTPEAGQCRRRIIAGR